jgi:hypothetical protein
MASKIKNIIILLIIAAALILIYVFFIKKSPDEANLTSSSPEITNLLPNTDISSQGVPVDTEFLSILLSIKNIRLNDTIFSSLAFTSFRDSSITLDPDGTEGRQNPFAPIGFDATTPTTLDLSTQTDTTENPIDNQIGALTIPEAD